LGGGARAWGTLNRAAGHLGVWARGSAQRACVQDSGAREGGRGDGLHEETGPGKLGHARGREEKEPVAAGPRGGERRDRLGWAA
jgi:hypothetical protein